MLGWFRRHATILMVVLGSAAMAIFGLGSVFESWARSANEKVRVNPAIATWAGGELTQDGVMGVYKNHAESLRFLNAVVDAAETKSGDRVKSLAQMISPIQSNDRKEVMNLMLNRVMMAQAAQKQGFVVGDAMVSEYVALISGDAQFSKADLEVINRSVNQVSLDVVNEHLKIELLAMQRAWLSMVGMNLPPNPTEAISLYGRTAERIECEVIPVAVSDFIDKVTDEPSDSELRELFKEGKNDFVDRTGEKPGFKINRKINVQYFVAEAETFLQNEMSKITDEEVQKEYDRLVKKNDVIVLEPIVKDNSFVIPGLDSLPAMPNSDDDSKPENDPSNDDAPAMPSDDAPAMPSDDKPTIPGDDAPAIPGDTPAMPSDAAPAVTTPVGDSMPLGVPATQAPTTEVPATPATEDPAPGSSSHTIRRTRTQFVSVQEVVDQVVDKVQEAGNESTNEAASSVELPQTDLPQTDLPQSDEPEAGGIGSDIAEELKKQEAAPERKYRPLTDVADSIRRSLALPKANAKMTKAIETVTYELEDYYGDYDIWENEESSDPNSKPAVPDFEKMAKELNLRLKQTGLVDRNEMRQNAQLGDSSFSDSLFFEATEKKLYEGIPYNGASPSVPDDYLFWNIEKEDPRVPDFDECKEQVRQFWTKGKAFELAQKEAMSISNKVNDDRKSKMSELYPNRALPTGEFSWFDTLRGGILSQPGNVERPSDDFMATAFSLVELEAGVAVDRGRDTVYVIQSISGSRPVNEIGNDYLQNRFMKFKQVPREVNYAAVYYQRQEQGKAVEALREELDFEYVSDFKN